MRTFFVFLLSLQFILLGSSPVFAQTNDCQPVNGDEKTCSQSNELSIDKKVENPDSKEYVNNLSAGDPKYRPDQNVNFKITIMNTSDKTIPQISVTDYFPNYVTFVNGVGEFNKEKGIFMFTISNLNAKEARVYFITGKVAPADKLPGGEAGCVINQAKANFGDQTSQDNSLFCIKKEEIKKESPTSTPVPKPTDIPKPTDTPTATPTPLKVYPPAQVTKTPETGPGVLGVGILLPAAVSGLFLIGLAKKK